MGPVYEDRHALMDVLQLLDCQAVRQSRRFRDLGARVHWPPDLDDFAVRTRKIFRPSGVFVVCSWRLVNRVVGRGWDVEIGEASGCTKLGCRNSNAWYRLLSLNILPDAGREWRSLLGWFCA